MSSPSLSSRDFIALQIMPLYLSGLKKHLTPIERHNMFPLAETCCYYEKQVSISRNCRVVTYTNNEVAIDRNFTNIDNSLSINSINLLCQWLDLVSRRPCHAYNVLLTTIAVGSIDFRAVWLTTYWGTSSLIELFYTTDVDADCPSLHNSPLLR